MLIRSVILFLLLIASAGRAFAESPHDEPGSTPKPIDAKTLENEKICREALNADPMFAEHVVRTINDQTAQQHIDAADHVAKNERHVILAYAAMWVVAAGFVIFLWRRQQALQHEILHLRRDLDAAAKDGK